MDEGYILSNKYRRVIFDGFINGETNIKFIAKKHRIISSVAEKITQDFIDNKILEKRGNKYILTDEGKRLAEIIKG